MINEKLLKNTKYGKYIDARYKTLWTGTWNSGSITVQDVSKYNSIIVMVDNNDPIVCHKDNSGKAFRGATILGGANSSNQYSKLFDCSVNGNVLTWSASKELGHSANGNHNSGSNKTVSKIIGLDPILESL